MPRLTSASNFDEQFPKSKQVAIEFLVPKKHQGPINWFIFVDLLGQAVKTLLNGCPTDPNPQPVATTPEQAVEFINWRPLRIFDWRGQRLEAHRRRIKAAVARSWSGARSELPEVQQNIMDAIDQGKVTVALMRGLYEEHRDDGK